MAQEPLDHVISILNVFKYLSSIYIGFSHQYDAYSSISIFYLTFSLKLKVLNSKYIENLYNPDYILDIGLYQLFAIQLEAISAAQL